LSPEVVKQYATTFATPGFGRYRRMVVDRVRLHKVDGRVARVNAELAFQFMYHMPMTPSPQAMLKLILTTKHRVSATKTLLQADTGVWYVYDGDLLERGASRSASTGAARVSTCAEGPSSSSKA
jgi:hypothetical protein